MRRRLVLALVALLSTAACGRKKADEAPCGTVGARLFALAETDLGAATVDPATRRRVADQLPAMRDALVAACSDTGWSGPARNCMANAPDHAAFTACQQQLTDAQRQALDRAARGETPSH